MQTAACCQTPPPHPLSHSPPPPTHTSSSWWPGPSTWCSRAFSSCLPPMRDNSTDSPGGGRLNMSAAQQVTRTHAAQHRTCKKHTKLDAGVKWIGQSTCYCLHQVQCNTQPGWIVTAGSARNCFWRSPCRQKKALALCTLWSMRHNRDVSWHMAL